MNRLFNSIRVQRPPRNMFDLSHERKWTGNMGFLTPILCQEVLPGDKWSVQQEDLTRLQPLQSPMYQRVKKYTSYYFVPSRILWNKWEKFITGGPDGNATAIPPYYQFTEADRTAGWMDEGSLLDYMGIPIPGGVMTTGPKVNLLPFRAYQMIYNDYYRDQNIITELVFDKDAEGDMALNAELQQLLTLRKVAWQKDMYTSALPNAQRGGSVGIPGSGGIPLFPAVATDATGQPTVNAGPMTVAPGGAVQSNAQAVGLDTISELTIAVTDLRKANRLQQWLEKNAIAGARLFEHLLIHWGVRSSDGRLQRPEFLGGASSPIVISEILSTFQNADDTGYPQGTMAGHGISVGANASFKRTFEEHGYIIGVQHYLPTTGYQQGVHPMFLREDKFDYAFPEFAQVGEQPVRNQELYFDFGTSLQENNNTFGYQSRYVDYKYMPNTTHGNFRSSLAYWHQNRIFNARPNLNKEFIEADPDNRVFAVTDPAVHHLLVNTYHNIRVVRSLPYYGTPTL